MTPALLLLFALAPPVDGRAQTLTELVTISASQLEGTEVVSSKDIQNILALEAEKQVMGCESGAECLAEIAGALGARLVVFGQLGSLEDELILTLNLYDAERGESVARAARRSTSLKTLSAMIDPMVVELAGEKVKKLKSANAVRLLVMDLENVAGPPSGAVEDAAPKESSASPTFIAGTSALGVGALAIVVAGIAGGFALADQARLENKSETVQRDVPGLIETRDTSAFFANVMLGVGVSAALAGGGILLVGGVE